VESIPRRGYYVREITTIELIDIFDCREVLEGLAARLIAEKASDFDIQTITDCFTPFMDYKGPIDEHAYEKADQRFHSLIKLKCGNTILSRVAMIGNIHILAYQRGLLRPPDETLPEHKKIIRALVNRKADEAEEAMRIHLRRSRKSLEKYVE